MISPLETPPPSFDAAAAKQILRDEYNIDGDPCLLVSERDQNFRVDVGGQPAYLLKIANAAESPDAIEYENAALEHLRIVAPQVPVPRIVPSVNGSTFVPVSGSGNSVHLARLIGWMQGRMLREIEPTLALRRELGVRLAELGRGLRGFFHPAAAKPLMWDITRLPELEDRLEFVDGASHRAICTAIIDRFANSIRPVLKTLRAQVIYNDLNPSNVLVEDRGTPRISGIVDLGDMVHGPLICDVAVAAAYQLTATDDPLDTAIEFVAAYHRVTPLESAELDVLFDLVLARLVTTMVITSWRANQYPENATYILRNAHAARRNLALLAMMDTRQVADRFHHACPAIAVTPTLYDNDYDNQEMISRRKRLLGSAYRLFYERPVHIVRGESVWLHDADGRTYLDAYNNVPLVGHCHPRVVAALSQQAATINVHTRYLHNNVLQYAEQLLAMFPPALNRVMFGCTGSEANELAIRIARAYTGNRGVIASRYAYHGNTSAIAQLSPSYMAAEDSEDWVEFVAPPDSYRAGINFLAELDGAIERLASRGIKPAALLLDAGFTSDGLFPSPQGLLQAAANRVRAAGGIYIADEVQSGFARFGDTLWGFQRDDVVPEIVTLGKPIGNGHPLSATVVNDSVLDAFSSRSRYFNTFGGNPVSAAVGLAVLEVFQREKLAENSLETGNYLHNRLRTLMEEFTAIGDIRGGGLFAGVDLVRDRSTKEPATRTTKRVVNAMRDRGVLISMIGPEANVLKIRPPLPFQRRHVDQLVETLGTCLGEATRGGTE